MLCADLVDARWRDREGRARSAVANLEDISLSGACIQLDEPLDAGTRVTITYPRGEFTGVVRYCAFRQIGYFAGIQFEPGNKWSQRSYKPLHLLDPRSLKLPDDTSGNEEVSPPQ
jgi:hypothetical protein